MARRRLPVVPITILGRTAANGGGYELRWKCPVCGHWWKVEILENHEIVFRLQNAEGNNAPLLPRTPLEGRVSELASLAGGRPQCKWWGNRRRALECKPQSA